MGERELLLPVENLVFLKKDKTNSDGGGRACPTRTAPVLYDNAVLPFRELSLFNCTSGGGNNCKSPKERYEKLMRTSCENHVYQMRFRSWYPSIDQL